MGIEPGAMCIEPGAVSIEPARMSKRFFGNRYWRKESRKESLQDDDEGKLRRSELSPSCHNGIHHHTDRRSVRAQCRLRQRALPSSPHYELSSPSSGLRCLLLPARSLSAPGPLRAASACRTPVAPFATRPRPSRWPPGGEVLNVSLA